MAQYPSTASRNLRRPQERSAFILSAPKPAPRRTNPLLRPGTLRRRGQFTWGWGLGRRSARVEMATLSLRVPAGSQPRAPSHRPLPETHPVEHSGSERDAGESRAPRLLQQRRRQPAHLRVGAVEVRAALQGHSPERKPAPAESQRTRSNPRLAAPHWTSEEGGTQKRKLERLAEGKAWDRSQEIWYGETLIKSLHLGFPRGKHRYQIRCPPKPLTSRVSIPGELVKNTNLRTHPRFVSQILWGRGPGS